MWENNYRAFMGFLKYTGTLRPNSPCQRISNASEILEIYTRTLWPNSPCQRISNASGIRDSWNLYCDFVTKFALPENIKRFWDSWNLYWDFVTKFALPENIKRFWDFWNLYWDFVTKFALPQRIRENIAIDTNGWVNPFSVAGSSLILSKSNFSLSWFRINWKTKKKSVSGNEWIRVCASFTQKVWSCFIILDLFRKKWDNKIWKWDNNKNWDNKNWIFLKNASEFSACLHTDPLTTSQAAPSSRRLPPMWRQAGECLGHSLRPLDLRQLKQSSQSPQSEKHKLQITSCNYYCWKFVELNKFTETHLSPISFSLEIIVWKFKSESWELIFYFWVPHAS